MSQASSASIVVAFRGIEFGNGDLLAMLTA
jgi:hypothetical protein